MAEAETISDVASKPARGLWPKGWFARIALILAALVLIALTIVWFSREEIAGNVIDDALADAELEATYEIESIGADRQVIRNLVIGDPASPDLTADQVIVNINYSFGSAELGRIELVRPRLFATFRDGALSFGALDPLIFTESEEPPGLPEFDIAIRDGRARIDSDYGVIGAKIDGEGSLDDGFAGTLAATAPGVGIESCSAQGATLYGSVKTDGGELGFDGPVRFSNVSCEGAQIASADIAAEFVLARDFSSVDATLFTEGEGLSYGEFSVATLTGPSDLAVRLAASDDSQIGDLTLRHDLEGGEVSGPGVTIGTFAFGGTLRAGDSFERLDWELETRGAQTEIALGDESTFAAARAGVEGTLFESLLAKFERGLTNALQGGQLAADASIRIDEGITNVIIPEARLRSGSGETVLALSRVSYSSVGNRIVGNILTAGADLPRITGRMEQVVGGDLALRLAMEEYRAGSDRIAIPRLQARQDAGGRYSFDGLVQAQGAIPGGSITGLELPIEGAFDPASGLAIGTRCTPVKLSGLSAYDLNLTARTMIFCPVDGRAIASYRDRFELAAQTGALELNGQMSGTPTKIKAGRAVLRYPGPFNIDGMNAVIGEEGNAVRLAAKSLEGSLGEDISGTFADGSAAIDAVPLDLGGLSGNWSYRDDALTIVDGALTLTERTGPGLSAEARFEPLSTNSATLVLADNVIEARAPLRRDGFAQLITSVAIMHDLSTGTGRADLEVPGIRFTDSFQPENLTPLTKGVVAFADGLITGVGQIAWTAEDIQSSGVFRTDDFDFAAAFGPVDNVSGEIVFTDLLNLTTAPDQVVQIGSVNPGIEALGGEVIFTMVNATTVDIKGGSWPFMGGELILRPTTFTYGSDGGQSYVFELIALDAASFVAQMELTNLGATGTFDGTIPIYFDPEGNGFIQGGLLISRAPGGNVAYVGELTYEDLGVMGNYAFQTLRSLDYNQMSVELNGSLAGEIVTNFQIDGVRQGEGASQNIVTRELAKLPIRFKINVRSDNFFTLAKIVRGFFDPTIFADDFDRELLGIEAIGRVPVDPEPEPDPSAHDDATRRDESLVQPSESDELP